MATLEIVDWIEGAGGFTAWDAHAKDELKRRLRSAMSMSLAQRRLIFKAVQERRTIKVEGVKNEQVERLRQTLETMGAEVEVSNLRN